MSKQESQPSVRKGLETEAPKPPQKHETTPQEKTEQRPQARVAIGELARHRTETFGRLFDGADEDTREVLERLQPTFETAVDNLTEDVQQLLDNRTLSEDEEREARLDILSQFTVLEELTVAEGLPIEKAVLLRQSVTAIHDQLASFHFHELDRINPEGTRRAIKMATAGQRGGAAYGEVAQKLGEKIRHWVEKQVQKTTEYLRSKTTSERLQDMLDRIGKSPLPGKIAFGATALTIGLFALGRGDEAFAEVDVSVDEERGTMTIEKEGQTPITLAPLEGFGTTTQENPIEDQTFEYLRTQEKTLGGVNYTIENPEQFQQFLNTEMQRLLPIINSEGLAHTENLQEMTPREIVLLATRIVEDNLTFDRAANQYNQELYSQAENDAISTMPLDRLLIEHKQGVCRHYAALVEKIAETLFEQTANPGNRNIIIDEIDSSEMRHGYTILFELQRDGEGHPTIRTSFLDAVADDADGTFNNHLDALSRIHPSRLAFIQRESQWEWGEERLFTKEEELTALKKLADTAEEGTMEHSWACAQLAHRLLFERFEGGDEEERKTRLEQVREYAHRAGAIPDEKGGFNYVAGFEWRAAIMDLIELTDDADERTSLAWELYTISKDLPYSRIGVDRIIAQVYEKAGDNLGAELWFCRTWQDDKTRYHQEAQDDPANASIGYDLQEYLSFYQRQGLTQKMWEEYDQNQGLLRSVRPESGNAQQIADCLSMANFCMNNAETLNTGHVQRVIERGREAAAMLPSVEGTMKLFSYEWLQHLARRLEEWQAPTAPKNQEQ